MGMFEEMGLFLVESILGFFALMFLLRFYFQVGRISFANPVGHFVVRVTDFAVKPARRVIRPIGRYDTATPVLAWITLFVMLLLGVLIQFGTLLLATPHLWIWALVASLVAVFRYSVYLLVGALIVQVVFSWINPYNPLMPLLDGLTRRWLLPLRRILPAAGGVDFSPMVLSLILMLLLIALRHLEAQLLAALLFGRAL